MTGNRRAGIVLQNRDRNLLSELGVMRIMDREVARVIGGFASIRRANRRLLLLTRSGLLRRFFVGSVAHGRKSVYTLSDKGAALVSAKLGGIHRASGRLVVGDAFVEHQSGINEIYLALKYRPVPLAGIRLLRWHTFGHPISEVIKLTPDGYFEIAVIESVRPMFLEIDLGTEALSVWHQKTGNYLQLAVSGEFLKRFRQQQFRVLVVANSDRRLANIRATVAKSTNKIFWFTTLDNIHCDGFWASIWLRPTGDQRHSLL
jgi:Replication-relaxation